MRVLLGIAGFELRELLRRVSTWVYLAALFAISFVVTLGRAGAWEGMDMGQPLLLANSPLRIATLTLSLSILGVPITAALAGRAMHRDFETRSYTLFFTTPISRWSYLGGRYLGAVAANAIILLGIPAGIALAAASGAGQPERIAAFHLDGYAHAMLVIALPNLLFTAAIFLVLAALTRRMLPNYAGSFVLLVGWALALTVGMALGDDWLVWLMDPFGLAPTVRSVRYWTIAEQNGFSMPLPTLLLANRALWLTVGSAALALGGMSFRFEHGGVRDAQPRDTATGRPAATRVARVQLEFGARAQALQLLELTRRSVRFIVRDVWFGVIVATCLLFVLVTAQEVGSVMGTRTYPVTYLVLESLTGVFALFVLLVITVYAGELVWNERELRVAGQVDASPVPSWVLIASRIGALVVVVAVLLALCGVCGALLQASRGYFRFEPALYLRVLLGHWLISVCIPVIAFAVLVHTLVNHKYMGHFVVVLYFVWLMMAEGVGLEHNLWSLGSAPSQTYSDMNGWGHAAEPWRWYALYWNGAALLMAVAATLFWQRGEERGSRWRLLAARGRLTRPALTAAAAATVVMLGAGGWILYNTTVLNDFPDAEDGLTVQERYERQYKRYEWIAQPRVTRIALDVDIHPQRRALRVRGSYRLHNRTAQAVPVVHVDLPSSLAIRGMSFDRPAARVIADSAGGYYAFRLATPLAPGDSTLFSYEVGVYPRGFTDEPEWGPVLWNGTFFNQDMLPRIGYNAEGEITDVQQRIDRGLPPRPRVASIDDARHRRVNPLAQDADWIDFEVTLSTSPGQVAIAPGRLERRWSAGGRSYFRYRMESPIAKFFAFQSGRYALRRGRWRDVSVEVYHHPGHGYNVGRMLESVNASLEYFSREFGPYQHRQLRIVEFPRYGDYAQSYPNTVPYSEGIGFIADVRGSDLDYPYFVTAHEVAHQWWGHQVLGAAVQGESMLSESLAEYSALMVMERRYGREQIGRFLEHELDQYLRGRGSETRAEQPLARVERQQYIHYNKGGHALYALRDYIGEERLHAALRRFLEEWRFRGPPYPTTRDLLRHVRAETPDSLRYLVDDLFERITLWDLRAEEGMYEQLPGGRWRVHLWVNARKLQADSVGNEQEVPMNDLVDIGVFGDDPERPLYLRKHRIRAGESEIVVEVAGRPERAGIDPRHKLIDRIATDNETDLYEDLVKDDSVAPDTMRRP